MKVQIVTPYRVSHLQRYGVTVHGNITSVCPPVAGCAWVLQGICNVGWEIGVQFWMGIRAQ
jgi:hypothetical protein